MVSVVGRSSPLPGSGRHTRYHAVLAPFRSFYRIPPLDPCYPLLLINSSVGNLWPPILLLRIGTKQHPDILALANRLFC